MKDTLWYIDPVWGAQVHNPLVDVTSLEDIKYDYDIFFKNTVLYYDVNACILKYSDPNDKYKVKYLRDFNIISEDGLDNVDNLLGPITTWVHKGEHYAGCSMFVISMGKYQDVYKSVIRHTLKNVKDNFDNDGLEYIE
jgi:hypothetical protein